MTTAINRNPDAGGFGGGGDPGAAAGTQSAGNAPASDGSGAAAETAGASPAAQSEPAGPDWAAIHAGAQSGAEVPEEFLEEYMQKTADGFFDQQQEAGAPEQASQPQYTEAEKKLMAEFGAKTPEEATEKGHNLRNLYSQANNKFKLAEQALFNQEKFIEDLVAGKPEAIAYAEQKTGRKPKAQGATAAEPTQPENPYAKFLLTNEEIEGSLDPSLGKAFNAKLQAMAQAFHEQQEALSGRLGDVDEYKSYVEGQRRESSMARGKSSAADNILKIIEAHPDDYAGLAGKPARAFVERYLDSFRDYADPSLVPPEFAELHEVVELFRRKGVSWEEAHAIRCYGGMNGKLAEARIAAAKPASRPPTVGVAGANVANAMNAAQNLSDSQIADMAAGKLGIPEAYLEDGLPVPGKCPQKLYDAIMNYKAA